MRNLSKLLSILIKFFLPNSILAEEIGSVDTVFKLFGPDNKIVIEAFDDPDINKYNLLSE